MDPIACTGRDAVCPQDLPACGCDGKVYPDACAAYQAGVDIGGSGPGKEYCAHDLTPLGRFACGPWFCDPAISYCFFQQGDVGDRAMRCEALPAGCAGLASCECVPKPPIGESYCSSVEGNGVTGIIVFYPII